MAIPGKFDLTLPVLRLLADGTDKSKRYLVERLGDAFRLTPEDLALTRSDGRNLFQNRIEWARTYLKKAGLIEYPKSSWSRITLKGVQLLACEPGRLDETFFRAARAPEAASSGAGDAAVDETLEDELRRLCGEAVERDSDWEIIRRINGWGPENPLSYEKATREFQREKSELLRLGKRCRQRQEVKAPLLDATLRVALSHLHQDPDELALELVMDGFTHDTFSLLGLCEAARRFGRDREWRTLLGYLSDHSERHRVRPRPFDSWFEVDVFLQLVELGYEVQPQKQIGRYRVDMYLPDFVPAVVIECDGDRYHRADRTEYDEARERWLCAEGYNVIRFRYSTYRDKPQAMGRGLAEILEQLGGGRQLRLA